MSTQASFAHQHSVVFVFEPGAMGIKFYCPNGHKLNVKSFLAGKRGLCPQCGTRVQIPEQSEIGPGEAERSETAGVPDKLSTQPAEDKLAGDELVQNRLTPPAEGSGEPGAPTIRDPLSASLPAQTAPADRAAGVAAQAAERETLSAASGSADPIAVAPDALWYVRPPAGGQYGPARGEIMRRWIAEGRVSADSLVWREGWSDWQTADQVFRQFAAAPPPPAGAPIGHPLPSSPISTPVGVAPGPQVAKAPQVVAVQPVAPQTAATGGADRSGAAAAPRTRRRSARNRTVAAVMVLGFASIALIVVLIYLLQQGSGGSP